MAGCATAVENLPKAHQEHRNLRSVFCRKPRLDLTEALRVKGDSPFRPQRRSRTAMDDNCRSELAS